MCANFQLKQTTLTFSTQICPKRKLGFEIQKTNVGIRISILEIPNVQIFWQNGQLWLFRPKNLPKNEFWGRNFKHISLDLKSVPPIYHVCQFSVKMNNFWFFGTNLGKLPSYVQYFGSNIVEGVTESWLETEMSWVETNGDRWRLKWAGWRWMEVDGAGWS